MRLTCCVCVGVVPPFHLMSKLADFDENWYALHAVVDHSNAVLFSYLESLITKQQ
jgi:hypothetical protein